MSIDPHTGRNWAVFYSKMRTPGDILRWASTANGAEADGQVLEPDNLGATKIADALRLLEIWEMQHRKKDGSCDDVYDALWDVCPQ